jgi:chaperonin GroEL (HSP60 family)
VIPLTLAENAGLDTIDIDVNLKAAHNKGQVWHGVDVFKGDLSDMMESNVVEPLVVKEQLVKAATEVASMILRIDDVIAASKLKEEKGGKGGGPETGPEEFGD